MTPYYEADGVTIYHGDCRAVDAWLTADVLVTDPPYGRSWRQGDTNTARGWAPTNHAGIANDAGTGERDFVLAAWGSRPALVFGDLMVPPPPHVKHVLIYDKGRSAGFTGSIAGFRRNAEAIFVLGSGWKSGLGGASCVLTTAVSTGGNLARQTGHPHTKPLDLMEKLVAISPPGVVADPFMGSGTTLVAAASLGRRAIGVEVDERYCEVAANRLAQGALDFGAAS